MAEKVITPEATLCYPALFEPKPTPSGELKYSCASIFQKGADLSALKKAALPRCDERWGAKAAEMLQRSSCGGRSATAPRRRPRLRPRARLRQRHEAGSARDRRPLCRARRQAAPDHRSGRDLCGCFVRASLRPFAYDVKATGASPSRCNVQKLGEGPRLDGRMRPEDEFEALEDAPAPTSRTCSPEAAWAAGQKGGER